MTAVKICGMTRETDVLAAAHAGAHAVGFVFHAPSPRYVTPQRAAQLAAVLPPFVTTVGLFVDLTADTVVQAAAEARLNLLQFHGAETAAYCREVAGRCGLPYIKAVRVRPGLDLLQYARDFHDAKALLLDAFVEGIQGGTGQTFDWSLIPRSLPLPIVLAGGLTPDNVSGAIRAIRPWAVDVLSGVEAQKGIKDVAKIAAFMTGVRNADV